MTDDDGSTEYWRDIKQARQEKHASNRERSADLLREAGIEFESKNGGAHLVVGCYDFWPGTGLWMRRGTKSANQRNYGVRNLIYFMLQNPWARKRP